MSRLLSWKPTLQPGAVGSRAGQDGLPTGRVAFGEDPPDALPPGPGDGVDGGVRPRVHDPLAEQFGELTTPAVHADHPAERLLVAGTVDVELVAVPLASLAGGTAVPAAASGSADQVVAALRPAPPVDQPTVEVTSTRPDRVTIRAIDRSFPRCRGPGKVWLTSPYPVTASAIAGRDCSIF